MGFFIILTGDELIEGRLADTNGSYLAAALFALGFEPAGMVVVGDDRARLTTIMRQALADNDIVVCSGGLGGTPDDLTRYALADAVESPLVVNVEAMGQLKQFWARLKRTFPSDKPLEAMMPASARAVANKAGLAPGMFVEHKGAKLLCLPGVPSELKQMIGDGVLELFGPPQGKRSFAALRVIGMREPVIAQVLGDIMERGRNPLCGIAAQEGEVLLSLRASAASQDQADRAIQADVTRIKDLLGDKVISEDGSGQVQIIAEALRRKGQTVAIAESLTGGLLGHQFTEIPGVSDVFLAGFVTYSNAAKVNVLGVDRKTLNGEGAVSEGVARQMAKGALARGSADFAVATTGIAGPTGGSAEKPVGLCWVAAASKSGEDWAESRVHGGSRGEIKRRSATHALDLLRRLILSFDDS